MRRAIIAISYMFFGASILVFISALLIPLFKQSSPKNEISRTENTITLPQTTGSVEKSTNNNDSSEPETSLLTNETSPSDETEAVVSSTSQSETTQPVKESPSVASALPIETQQQETSSDDHQEPAESTQLTGTLIPTEKSEESAVNKSTESKPDDNTAPSEAIKTGTTLSKIKEVMADPANDESLKNTVPTSLLVLGEGYFSPGAISPNETAQDAIDKIISFIKARPTDNVIVEGHADNMISDRLTTKEASRMNKTISLRRAIAVAMILEQKGVDSDKIIVSGLGDTVPMASNLTEEGRAKNRRVEIKLSPTQ